jgi:hypothetical protein
VGNSGARKAAASGDDEVALETALERLLARAG